jgi:hypothetical protein
MSYAGIRTAVFSMQEAGPFMYSESQFTDAAGE